jgi:hypothetical protein
MLVQTSLEHYLRTDPSAGVAEHGHVVLGEHSRQVGGNSDPAINARELLDDAWFPLRQR